MKDKNGCIIKKGYNESDYDFDINGCGSAHTITCHDVVQPDGTVKRHYDINVPTLKLGNEDDKV